MTLTYTGGYEPENDVEEPTEPVAPFTEDAPLSTSVIVFKALLRFWTHVSCAALVPALVIVTIVAWSEWRECIGGAHVGYTSLRGFSGTCIEPTPIVEPGQTRWWYDDIPGDRVERYTIFDDWTTIGEQYTEHRLKQSVIMDPLPDLMLTLNGSPVAIDGENQLKLGKTNKYLAEVPCNESNVGSLLFFERSKTVRVCNGNLWREL